MTYRAFLSVVLLAISTGAGASVADLLNGVTVGERLPPHELKYVQGSASRTDALTIVDFWATWCSSCRAAIPKLNALHGRGKVQLVGVTQEDESIVQSFTRRAKIEYPVAIDVDQRLHQALKIRVLPYAIIVGTDGRILWRGQPEEIDQSLLEQLKTKREGKRSL